MRMYVGLVVAGFLLGGCASRKPASRVPSGDEDVFVAPPQLRYEMDLCRKLNVFYDSHQDFRSIVASHRQRQLASLERDYHKRRNAERAAIAVREAEYAKLYSVPFQESVCKSYVGDEIGGSAHGIAEADMPRYRSDPELVFIACENRRNFPEIRKAAERGVFEYEKMLPGLRAEQKRIEAAYGRRYRKKIDYERCE